MVFVQKARRGQQVKLLVDAMCAEYGGIRTYVDHLLGQWGDVFPDDEVHVALRVGSTLTTGNGVRHELPVRGPDVVGRPLAQTRALPRLAREPRRRRGARDRAHHDRPPAAPRRCAS